MHFNRTEFATKTEVRLFFVAILILVFLLTSCTGGEIEQALDNLFSSECKWSVINFSFPLATSPTFKMDSIVYDSIAGDKLCCSIRFDSTIVLRGFSFNCWETTQIRQTVVDTIDFRVRGAYVHNVRMAKIKRNTVHSGLRNGELLSRTRYIADCIPGISFRAQ
jgi:hypothetical protein